MIVHNNIIYGEYIARYVWKNSSWNIRSGSEWYYLLVLKPYFHRWYFHNLDRFDFAFSLLDTYLNSTFEPEPNRRSWIFLTIKLFNSYNDLWYDHCVNAMENCWKYNSRLSIYRTLCVCIVRKSRDPGNELAKVSNFQ